MIGYLFSGQGSQYSGMGNEFYKNHQEVKRIYEMASDVCHFDVAEASFMEDKAKQAQTHIAQMIIFTHSLASFTVASKFLPTPNAMAGHSLGEYGALVCGGVISMEDGFEMIKYRGEAMAKAPKGSMVAILKCTAEQVEEVCLKTEGMVKAVNYNSPTQTVIAGEIVAVQRAVDTLKTMGARAIPLAVSGAFHTPLMKESADEFAQKIAHITFNKPHMPIYSNVTGIQHTQPTPDDLKQHMISPVKFTTQLHQMQQDGIGRFVEIGPSKVLSGLVKKTLHGVDISNIEDESSLQATIDKLNG